MTTIPATPDNTATNGTPLGWGYHDCIARAVFQSAGSGPREAADAVLAELAKQGYTVASTTGTASARPASGYVPRASITPVPDDAHVQLAASYEPGDRVLLGPPGKDKGTGTVIEFVDRTNTEIPGGSEDVYSVLVDDEAEPRLWGTGWMRPAPSTSELVVHDGRGPTDG